MPYFARREGTVWMTYAPAVDPRVKRTRKLLQDALLSIMVDHDLSTITVQDITRRAEVNRATFYLHFRDRDDLLGQTLDLLFDNLTEEERTFVDSDGSLLSPVVPTPLTNLFRNIAARPALYRRLLGDVGSSAFVSRLNLFHEQVFLRLWADTGAVLAEGDSPPEFRAKFAASAIQGAMSWWLEYGQEESPESAAAWLWQLIRPLWFPQLGTDWNSTSADDDEP